MSRTRFNSSRLVRVLADLAGTDVPEPKQSFADRLGEWLDFKDALSLYSALNAGAGGAAEPGAATSSRGSAAARQAFDRVRSALVDAIAADGVLKPGQVRIELPTPAPEASAESAADFAAYHRYYLAHQRSMGANIGPLRATVRAVLSRQSSALKQLAVLDAVMEQALAAREGSLLATVPGLLGKRFEQLYEAHRARLAEAQTADDPARWMQPGGWLAEFRGEMQAVLLAELDLRLQPVAGLIAALDNEVQGGNE